MGAVGRRDPRAAPGLGLWAQGGGSAGPGRLAAVYTGRGCGLRPGAERGGLPGGEPPQAGTLPLRPPATRSRHSEVAQRQLLWPRAHWCPRLPSTPRPAPAKPAGAPCFPAGPTSWTASCTWASWAAGECRGPDVRLRPQCRKLCWYLCASWSPTSCAQAPPPETCRPVVLTARGPGAVGGAGLAEEEGPAGPELG